MLTENDENRLPEAASTPMFVGQIPRHFTETELKDLFEPFGAVFEINVLRDKQTGESKGCCLVRFYEKSAAVKAADAFHNKIVLAPLEYPIQMKPADLEPNRKDRKLFVGMISHELTEAELVDMFKVFGRIEDCTILRDPQGKSKGCAFITFYSKYAAAEAINRMHHAQYMKNCTSPINVRLADTSQTKLSRRIADTAATNSTLDSSNTLNSILLFNQLIQNLAASNQSNSVNNRIKSSFRESSLGDCHQLNNVWTFLLNWSAMCVVRVCGCVLCMTVCVCVCVYVLKDLCGCG